MVAFREVRCFASCVGIEADSEFEVAVLLVEIRSDRIAPRDERFDLGQGGQSCGSPGRLANGDRTVEAGDRVIGETPKFVVPLDDLDPVGLLDCLSVSVERSDSGLRLELAQVAAGERCLKDLDTLRDQAAVPQAAVLLSERYEPVV